MLISAPIIAQEPAATGEPPILTMEDAITMAVANSPTLAQAIERVDKSRNQVKEALAASRFQVSVSAQHLRMGPSSTITIPGEGGDPQTIQVSTPMQTTATATLTQPIDVSGGLSLVRKLAELFVDIQSYGEAQALQQLIADVKSAYYNVLRAQGNVDVVQASIAAAQERLRITQAQYDAGVAARFDVTQAEVSVANLQQTLIQAQNGVLVAKSVLNQIIGIDVGAPYTLEEQQAAVEPVTIDIDESTQRALQARPEMQQATLGVTMSEQSVELAAIDDKPKVGLFASTTWTKEVSAFSPNNTTYSFGASANWPIWTNGATKAKVAQAKNDVEIAKSTLDAATLGVTLDVRTAALNVMEASRRIQTSLANVDEAREALRLANVRYQEGVSIQVEVITAETLLTQAMTNLVNARYDYLSAQAQLQRATASQPEYKAISNRRIED